MGRKRERKKERVCVWGGGGGKGGEIEGDRGEERANKKRKVEYCWSGCVGHR